MSDRTMNVQATPGADRAAIAVLALGGLALVGAAALLWHREGVGVFVDVLLAGLAACF